MKKIMLISSLLLSSLLCCAQDFTGRTMSTVEMESELYNYSITKAKLKGLQQADFELYGYTECDHWVLRNDEKVIEIVFHPISGVVFLQTSSLKKYVKTY